MNAFRLPPAALAGICILSAVPLGAATVPDWAQAAVASASQAWRTNDPAVRLLDYESVRFTAPGRLVDTLRGVMRLQSQAGLDRTIIRLNYNPDTDRIVSVTVWLVSADQRNIRRLGRSDFTDQVVNYNQYFWDSERVLWMNPASLVEPGGFVAWEYQVEREPAFGGWDDSFNPDLPTLKTVFEAIPAPTARLDWYATRSELRAPTATPEAGGLHWEVSHLFPVPSAKPTGFVADSWTVYVRSGGAPDTWKAFSGKACDIMAPKAQPDAAIEAAAAGVVAGKKGRWNRIRALSEFVQHEIVYLSLTTDKDDLAGYRPHAAAEVLRNRYGDCKDKATLMVSMLRAIGEEGRVVLLFAGDPRFVRPEWPAPQFNHAIVAIAAPAEGADWPSITSGGRRYVIFDPTDPFVPLGILPAMDAGGYCLLVDGDCDRVTKLPQADRSGSRVVRTVVAALRPDGSLQAEVTEDRFGFSGAEEHELRAEMSLSRFQNALETRIHARNPQYAAFSWSDAWEPAPAHYRLAFRFSSAAYGRVLPNSMILASPEVLPLVPAMSAWLVRPSGVASLEPNNIDTEITLRLPIGYAVEELPDPWSGKLNCASASLDYSASNGEIVCRVRLGRDAGFYDKPDYEAIRRLYRDLSDRLRRPVLLKPAPTG